MNASSGISFAATSPYGRIYAPFVPAPTLATLPTIVLAQVQELSAAWRGLNSEKWINQQEGRAEWIVFGNWKLACPLSREMKKPRITWNVHLESFYSITLSLSLTAMVGESFYIVNYGSSIMEGYTIQCSTHAIVMSMKFLETMGSWVIERVGALSLIRSVYLSCISLVLNSHRISHKQAVADRLNL